MKVALGQVLMTMGARDVLTDYQMRTILKRHMSGDWGNVCLEDKKINDDALIYGGRLLSSYLIDGEKVWIITEADRASTTVLLPSEY